MVKRTTRARHHTAVQFETRMLGNTRVAQLCAITVTGVKVHFASNHADVRDTVIKAALNFPGIQEYSVRGDVVVVTF